MDCPHCHSSSTTEQEGRTVHGFRRFRCRECGRRYNERTGTVLNRVQVPTDIVFLVVFWRLRYKLRESVCRRQTLISWVTRRTKRRERIEMKAISMKATRWPRSKMVFNRW